MSDYMKEAERLLSEYGDAVSDAVVFAQDPSGYSMRMEEATRAALLAHIQRGAVPEGWQVAPINHTPEMRAAWDGAPDSEDDDMAFHFGYRAMLAVAPAPAPAAPERRIGPASDSDTVVYQSIADGYARDTAPATAEVPMPEPDVTTLYSYTDSTGEPRNLAHTHDQMRTYGDAREAAGYARGVADERERCASVAWAHYMDTCRRKGIGPDVLPDWCCAAALRGEVKP